MFERVHHVLKGMIGERSEQTTFPHYILKVLILEWNITDEGDDFITQQFGLLMLFEIFFGEVEDKKKRLQKENIAVDYFLYNSNSTWAKDTLTWKITFKLLKIYKRTLILKLGI